MKEFESRLVANLEMLRDQEDRAALARLRRGLGKEMGTPDMYQYVVPFLDGFPENLCFLVASLFAVHPEKAKRGISLGTVFKEIWEKSNKSESVKKRFTNLLSSDTDDIGNHLRHAVSLAKSRGVAIDYHRLLFDLKRWGFSSRRIQLDWAKDFWSSEKQQTEETMKGEII